MLLAPPGTGVPCKELTEVEILPPNTAGAGPGLHIIRGLLSLFHRDKPERIRTVTTAGVAGVKGTEFVIAVEKIGERELTTLFVIDGEVQFTNAQGTLTLTNGD